MCILLCRYKEVRRPCLCGKDSCFGCPVWFCSDVRSCLHVEISGLCTLFIHKQIHSYVSCLVISMFICVTPFIMFSFPRYPLRGWPVPWFTWIGTELPPAEWWASACFVFWKTCQVRTLAHWCCQWKSWTDSVPHNSEEQLGRFHQAFS